MTQRKPTADVYLREPYCLVAGFDFSDGSSLALDQALTLTSGLPCAALHVVWVPQPGTIDECRKLASASERLRDHVAARARAITAVRRRGRPNRNEVCAHVLPGSPARTINDFALRQGAHLIVVGSHGRAGLERVVLGWVAADVLAGAPCPVLIARGRAMDQLPRAFPARDGRRAISAAFRDRPSIGSDGTTAVTSCADCVLRRSAPEQ